MNGATELVMMSKATYAGFANLVQASGAVSISITLMKKSILLPTTECMLK